MKALRNNARWRGLLIVASGLLALLLAAVWIVSTRVRAEIAILRTTVLDGDPRVSLREGSIGFVGGVLTFEWFEANLDFSRVPSATTMSAADVASKFPRGLHVTGKSEWLDDAHATTLLFADHLGFAFLRERDTSASRGRGGIASDYFAAPFALPLAICSVGPLVHAFRGRQCSRRRLDLRCVACGYDLRGVVDRCPECGTSVKG